MRFCPNCGSTNVEFDTDHTNVLGELISNQNQWVCNECGYRGLMPEGDPEEFEESLEGEEGERIEFDRVEQDSVDTALGSAYFKYFMYISTPITIIYILLRLVF